jgi:ABC-type branched-subunit amino acid transport system substrate-binding protein
VDPLKGQKAVEYSDEAETLFRRGIVQYEAQRFDDASVFFSEIIRRFPESHRATGAYVMMGRSLFHLNDNLEAARTLRAFLSAFPASSYVPDAEYTLGLTYLRIRRYDHAVEALRSAWRNAVAVRGPEALLSGITRTLESTIDLHLSAESVRILLNESTNEDERTLFRLKLVEKDAARGNITAAARGLDSLEVLHPLNPYGERITLLRRRLEERSSVKLGALLPLMRKSEPSAAKEIGTDIHEGVVYAVEEYQKNPETRMRVVLETRDTERDPLVASREAQELSQDNDIIAIIGPVFSNTTAAAVGLASARGIPLITPTANSNGIAATGRYIFQANPDYENRGRAMARYAVRTRGFRVLAILAPIDTYGKFLAEGFTGEAIRLGAKIVATEWYQRGTSDLKGQLGNIRKAGMLESAEPFLSFAGKLNQGDLVKLIQLGVAPRTLDSLVERSSIVGATTLLGPGAKAMIDSLGITALYDDPRVDSLEYPVSSIQAIYIPISTPEEIGVFSSQLVYFNFQTQLMGSGEWNSFGDLHANQRYCDGIIFESDSHTEAEDPVYKRFVDGFFERFKKRPSKNTLFGYDTAALLLSLLHNGATSREGLAEALSGVRDHRTLHSRIDLSNGRVNSCLSILQYSSDSIQKIDEVNVNEP